MTQRLAIRGNCYNGDKVIALLLLLGGSNAKGYDGSKKDYCYYINSKGIIDCILLDDMLITQWETHTLLSFSEKYGNNPPQGFYYNSNIDKGKILNQEFNEVYDAITTAYEKITDFHIKHCAFIVNVDKEEILDEIKNLFERLGDCRTTAHEIAEYFTWDN